MPKNGVLGRSTRRRIRVSRRIKMEQKLEINLRDIFKVLLKRLWIIALCAILVGGAVLMYTMNFVVPLYQASVTIYVNNNSSRDSTYITSGDLAVALRLVYTYVNIIESDKVLERVIDETGLMLTASQIRGMLSAEPVDETEMFEITITSPNPQMSADIANAIASVAPAEIAEIIEGSSAKIIDEAKVPVSRSSPSYTLNAVVGGMVGAILSALVFILHYLLDKRIKSEEDLKEICEIPVLGVIPNLTDDAKNTGKKARR